ncbi:MAG: NUDIX hydrolase [Lentimicrobiaceae bacterium]|nr:NUDIX hydrolase [Lentimicrobiaceae bacterium]
MYTIFNNRKAVYFSDNVSGLDINEKTFVFTPASLDEIRDTYLGFEKSTQFDSLYCTGNRGAETNFGDFCTLFTIIEAAGGLVSNAKGQLLFIFRRGWWDLPKGKLEPGETPEEAALREVKEETGLNRLSLLYPLPSTWHIYPHRGSQVLKKTYWFAMQHTGNEKPVPQTEEDIQEVKWISPAELPQLLRLTYPSLVEMLKSSSEIQI